MNNLKEKNRLKLNRTRRTRAKIFGTQKRLRVSFFKSNRFNYAQAINDDTNKTVVGVWPKELANAKGNKTELAAQLGDLLAKKLKEAGVKSAIFDRRGNKYHGRLKAFVEALRKGGIDV